MRVLVTGASGFVGQEIVTQLAKLGHTIVGLSSKTDSQQETIKQVKADISHHDFVKRIYSQVEPCEAIIHLAASLNENKGGLSLSLTNGIGSQNVISLAKVWGARKLVNFSSIGVIGEPVKHPIRETHPVTPLTNYHASKLYGENLMEIARRDGLPTVSLRLTAPIGSNQPPNKIVSQYIMKSLQNEDLIIYGKGTRKQNYIDVRDIGLAVRSLIESDAQGIFNLGGKESISNLDLAERCIKTLGSKSKVIFNGEIDMEEGICWDVSIEKANRAFGYAPVFTLEDSIQYIGEHYASCINK